MSDQQSHWERIYRKRRPEELSWFQQKPERSLGMIEQLSLPRSAAIIDVGGGASSLVDFLLQQGWQDLTVLDISGAALQQARARLGKQAQRISWIEADITRFSSERRYTLWHDRAVFHFLTDEADRRNYMEVLTKSLEPGGYLLMATFAKDGPQKCSGLNVVQYCPESLASELGKPFSLKESQRETHTTQGGVEQRFVYCLFQYRPTTN